MVMLVLWVVTPCGLLSGHQRFGVAYCLHLRDWSPETFVFVYTSPPGVATQLTNMDIFTAVKSANLIDSHGSELFVRTKILTFSMEILQKNEKLQVWMLGCLCLWNELVLDNSSDINEAKHCFNLWHIPALLGSKNLDFSIEKFGFCG
jgi:hypothetical protein